MQNAKNINSSDDWQITTRSLSERGKHLLENPLWTDCKFLVGTEESHVREFEAHKLILSMTSPVFATMFNGGLPETKCPIKIVDVQPEAFQSMLEYIYTDTITLDSLDQACELCYIAKKYMLPHLLKKSVEFIWKDVDCDTALTAYEFAKLFDDPGILEKSMKIICERTTDVLSKGSVLNMSEETLLDILDQDELNVPAEVYLFNVVQSWVLFNVNRTENEKFEADKVRKFAKSAVRKIRFLTMSVSDFAEGPAQSQLITKDESFAILLNISSSQTNYPMPEDFTTSRTPRNISLQKVNRLSRKQYLQRPIKDSIVQFNVGSLTDTLHFISNDNVTLIGIQIPTQIAHAAINTTSSTKDEDSTFVREQSIDLESPLVNTKTKYREYLVLFVKEVQNPENTWSTHFTSLVDHNSVVNIMLTTPITVKRGYEYELDVTLIKKGYYLFGYFDRMVEKYSGNIKFILSGHTDTAFVSSLIYIH